MPLCHHCDHFAEILNTLEEIVAAQDSIDAAVQAINAAVASLNSDAATLQSRIDVPVVTEPDTSALDTAVNELAAAANAVNSVASSG